jgi:spermidine/putrescine transport system ATP-binding protein
VHDNVAFGLRYVEASKDDIRRRVGKALELVEMSPLAKRKPHQLSGGQQQRVALARALVLEPTVLLLDEPMGALDAKLRKQLQTELRSIQRAVGTTFVYVTHDQEEALTMSDRLAVLRDGRLMQVGAPSEVYSRPANAYVASFLGTANMYDAVVTSTDGTHAHCRVGDLEITAAADKARPLDRVTLVIRPERVEVGPTGKVDAAVQARDNLKDARVTELVFRGAHTQVSLDLAGHVLLADVPNVHGETPDWLTVGKPVSVRFSPAAVRLLPADARPVAGPDG